MIRQAISCDICGAEKRQSNHWFVAWEHEGELRITGWNARTRLRTGSKHLCGQACLHKLADDFMERIISNRAQTSNPQGQECAAAAPTDTSLIAPAVCDEFESSARLLSTPLVTAASMPRAVATLVPMPERIETITAIPAPEVPRYSSRSWHAEAWQRERERNLKAADRSQENKSRRISQA